MTRSRGINWVLTLSLLLPLGIWAWRVGRERAVLEATYAFYAREVGDLPVADPAKFSLLKRPTDSPMEFAWRMYCPPGCPIFVNNQGSGMRFTTTAADDGVARVNFRKAAAGGFEYRVRLGRGATLGSTIGDRSLSDLLRGRFDQLIVEQAGATEVLTADPAERVVLLRLRVPPAIVAEGRGKLTNDGKFAVPLFFELTLDPPGPKP